ncbi:MAG: hypothetical protein IJI45_18420 [Anaerolineaceae bacterium]|nr:hypothetical protein [Anaerolineaceae bacterium]
MITYDQIKRANDAIQTTDIKGKEYAEVNQRIKAFRMVFPDGYIITEMVSNENGVCVFNASCGFYEDGEAKVLGSGHAYEKEGSTFINKTSYIENCETSAVGRALGMAGFGIDTSVASYEEVQTAIANQGEPAERTASPQQIAILTKRYTGANLEKLLKANNIDTIEDMPMKKASELIAKLAEKDGAKNG